MEKSMIRPYHLARELSQLFDLDGKIDMALSVSIYSLNHLMNSERSSIFLFEPSKQHLTSFSSLDLEKHEIRFAKSIGVAGWVFEHRKPAVVRNAYEDSRFFRGVDDMTGFRTRNLICTPLLDYKDHCLGTLQSLNKKGGEFTTEDLELLDLTARMLAIAIKTCKRCDEVLINEVYRN